MKIVSLSYKRVSLDFWQDILPHFLILAFGTILIIHLIIFWIKGGVFIYEDNKAILTLETIMGVAILVYGLKCVYNLFTMRKRS